MIIIIIIIVICFIIDHHHYGYAEASEGSEQTKHWRGKPLFTNNHLPLQCFVSSEASDAPVTMIIITVRLVLLLQVFFLAVEATLVFLFYHKFTNWHKFSLFLHHRAHCTGTHHALPWQQPSIPGGLRRQERTLGPSRKVGYEHT